MMPVDPASLPVVRVARYQLPAVDEDYLDDSGFFYRASVEATGLDPLNEVKKHRKPRKGR